MNTQKQSPRILLIGNSARIHAIAETLLRSKVRPILYLYTEYRHDAFINIARAICVGKMDEMGKVYAVAKE